MSRLTLLAVVCACAAAACGSNTTTTPTTVTPQPLTDRFAGTLSQNGGTSFSFTTSQSGNVQATLSTLAPDATLLVGMGLGTWNGTSCQIVLVNDKAAQGALLAGATTAAGSLCVRIYDVGNVTDPATFELQVVHY